jgi:hypothetical protein
VIQDATRSLEWSGNADDLKLIYIAGNEPFTQGPVSFREAIGAAKQKGIVVNTIHCGGDEPSWRDGALVAGGNYLMINQNAVAAYVPTPQDAELAKLGSQLNKTYLGYGARGAAGVGRQAEMDTAAASAAPEAAMQRAVSKSSALYDNSEWDLVDAKKKGKAISSMDEEELPEELRAVPAAKREEVVEAKSKERTELQSKIAKLNAEREKFLEAERKKSAAPGEVTLDKAMIESVRTQGAKKDFKF